MTLRDDLAVVLCTFNGGRHVAAQVRSILDQQTLPGEIRVYDDGSTDGTLGLIEQAHAARPTRAAPVRLFLAPPASRSRGAAGNFAHAIADTPQPLVALADQDDEWLSDRLSATVAILDADTGAEVVASDAMMIDGTGRAVGRTVFEAQRLTRAERAAFARHDYLPALLKRNLVPGMTFTIRARLARELGALPEGAMHDYWLATAAAARGTLRLVPRPLVRYRIHGGNAVGLDAGTRSYSERLRIKVKSFRMPLTDLPQWIDLPDRLRAIDDEVAADRLGEKRSFEIRRRHGSGSFLSNLPEAVCLIRGEEYRIYDFQGRGAGLRDLVRRRDPFLAIQ